MYVRYHVLGPAEILAKIAEAQHTKHTEEGKTAAEVGGPHEEGQEHTRGGPQMEKGDYG